MTYSWGGDPGNSNKRESAICNFTDKWVYDGFTETYVLDYEMCQKLRNSNPEAFRNILKRLLEANGRGYWIPPDNILQTLQEMYEDVEDEVEFAGGDNVKTLNKVVVDSTNENPISSTANSVSKVDKKVD